MFTQGDASASGGGTDGERVDAAVLALSELGECALPPLLLQAAMTTCVLLRQHQARGEYV